MSDNEHLNERLTETKVLQDLQATLASRNLTTGERHLFLCTGTKCGGEKGQDTWNELKKLTSLQNFPNGCLRTQTPCLRICQHGPIGVLYPDGVWYHSLSQDNLREVVENHLKNGQIVERLVFHRTPKSGSTTPL